MAMDKEQPSGSRREFLRRAAYIAPAILSLQVAPAYAKAGSVKEVRKKMAQEKGLKEKKEKKRKKAKAK